MSMNLPKREELSLRIVLASSALTASSQSLNGQRMDAAMRIINILGFHIAKSLQDRIGLEDLLFNAGFLRLIACIFIEQNGAMRF